MDIRQEVISIIRKNFPQAVVYGEDKKQGFKAPCFLVYELEVGREKEVNRRYKETIPLIIQYFSDQKYVNDDCGKVRHILFETLEVLPLNKARAIKLNGQVIDDILNLKVIYKQYLIKEKQPVPKMQQLEERGRLHGSN